MEIKREDYEEPRCPLSSELWVKKRVIPIPADRVAAREDEYLAKNDYAGAERHLKYWWQEAVQGNDDRGRLFLCSELMGLMRKLGRGEEAKDHAQQALDLVYTLQQEDMISGATVFLNCGTVYKAFGEPERSLELFEKAAVIYERDLDERDTRRAGLYNNMALTLTDLGRYGEAMELYGRALRIMKADSDGQPDQAITLLNMADCVCAQLGSEQAEKQIQEYLDQAEALLESVPEEKRGGYYAFVCEKCAPAFEYHGYFLTAGKLKKLAETIYSRKAAGEA